MATRQIKDAKDLSTNELIYFKGHAKATYMSNGITVEDAINNISSSDKVTQTINLVSGTTLVSFYVNTSLEEVQQALGTNGLTITTSYDGGTTLVTSTFDSETNTWSGDLTELDLAKMYMIKVTEAATIEVSGELLNVENYTISLSPGWNWIGYPINEEINLIDALSELEPSQGDMIKSQTKSALWTGSKWKVENGFERMIPGEGYKYNNTSTETKTFTYPTKTDIKIKQAVSTKQDTLVSGTNIKTINGNSLLGEGDIVIESGVQPDWNETDTSSKAYIANKPTIISTGDGSNFLSNDGTYKPISPAYPTIEYASDNTTVTISPNVFHVWGEVVDLNIDFKDPEDYSVLNEYIFQFVSGSQAPALTLPETLMWVSGEAPTIEMNTIYQISIVNKCATVLAFPVLV